VLLNHGHCCSYTARSTLSHLMTCLHYRFQCLLLHECVEADAERHSPAFKEWPRDARFDHRPVIWTVDVEEAITHRCDSRIDAARELLDDCLCLFLRGDFGCVYLNVDIKAHTSPAALAWHLDIVGRVLRICGGLCGDATIGEGRLSLNRYNCNPFGGQDVVGSLRQVLAMLCRIGKQRWCLPFLHVIHLFCLIADRDDVAYPLLLKQWWWS
jgi:hypothetical protein